MKSTTSAATSRISNFLNMIVLVVLALALVSLALAFNAFMEGEEIVAIYLVIIGFIALGLSTYVLMQSRSRAAAGSGRAGSRDGCETIGPGVPITRPAPQLVSDLCSARLRLACRGCRRSVAVGLLP